MTALLDAGICRQGARCPIYGVEQSIVLTARGATLALHPPIPSLFYTENASAASRAAPVGPARLAGPTSGHELYLSYFLDYGLTSPIARQLHTQALTPGSFAQELASCRTFILEEEAAELRRLGLGTRTSTADLLVFGPRGPLDNTLRYANEPARHKVLDLVGDLSLLGRRPVRPCRRLSFRSSAERGAGPPPASTVAGRRSPCRNVKPPDARPKIRTLP